MGPKRNQSDVLSNLPGKKSKECVVVGKERDVRSGDMGAGPFDTARADFSPKSKKGRVVRLYFIPTHAAKLDGIVVSGRNATTGAKFTERTQRVSDAEQWKFYNMEIAVPDAGTWTIRAKSGADAGCWIVDLT